MDVVGVSVDSQFIYYAWRSTPVIKGGIGPVRFPMVADVRHELVPSASSIRTVWH